MRVPCGYRCVRALELIHGCSFQALREDNGSIKAQHAELMHLVEVS